MCGVCTIICKDSVKNLAENRRGGVHFAVPWDPNGPGPLSVDGFRTGSQLRNLTVRGGTWEAPGETNRSAIVRPGLWWHCGAKSCSPIELFDGAHSPRYAVDDRCLKAIG